jgi:nicotinamidase-related amidase
MKKLLIVVDYQNDFVTGSLGFPKAEMLEELICRKIALYRNAGNDIVFTLDTHGGDYLETMEGKKLPVPHCSRSTEGWQLYGKVAALKAPKDVVFEKPTFGSAGLMAYLMDHDYDSIELCGLVTNMCVLANAVIVKTARPDADIIIDASCTASFDESMHEKALEVLAGIHCTILNRN